MDELIKLVRTYRLTAGIDERLQLSEVIIRKIEPDLRLFVCNKVSHPAADDAMQEILRAIATGMAKFQGKSEREFWSWCYRIARNKLADHYRSKAVDPTHPTSPEELWRMMEVSAQDAPITAQTRLDLQHAINLLTVVKPECSDLLWQHYVFGFDYAEIAEDRNLQYDTVRMKIGRCLEEVKKLVS